MRDRIAGRLWRLGADARRVARRSGSAASARRSMGGPRRSDREAWHAATSEHHARYRTDHEPAATSAAIVTVSMRPWLIDDVVANIARQAEHLRVHAVFVANHAEFADIDLERHVAAISDCTVIETPPDTSLGTALNLGLDATSERFIAKFDDDDWYGAGYLADALRAHAHAGAGVVGKHSYYADVAGRGRFLRFPGNEFRYSSTLAGGTLVIDRDRTGGLEFEDRSLGEDRAFLAACHRRGVSTYSADRFCFVQRRGGDNTWAISDERFLGGCLDVDPGAPEHVVDRPPVEAGTAGDGAT
jgi:hypothetical protein